MHLTDVYYSGGFARFEGVVRNNEKRLRLVALCVFLLYFVGLPIALNLLAVGDEAQRKRWIASVFPIGFALVLILRALTQKKSISNREEGSNRVPRWTMPLLLVGAAFWLLCAWVPVVLGVWESPHFWP